MKTLINTLNTLSISAGLITLAAGAVWLILSVANASITVPPISEMIPL
jgi:hypothetical protein